MGRRLPLYWFTYCIQQGSPFAGATGRILVNVGRVPYYGGPQSGNVGLTTSFSWSISPTVENIEAFGQDTQSSKSSAPVNACSR